jgi:hypothetical protein
LYDPATETWSATGSLATARLSHTATLLPNGKVLAAGGFSGVSVLTSAELYDPASGTWSATGSLVTAREFHTATLLPNGKVLVAGGVNFSGVLASAELYDVGLGFSSAWQPLIATAPSTLTSGDSLALTGSVFKGISEASGGNGAQNSSSNYPVVQLRSIDNSQVAFLLVDPTAGWSDTAFTSVPVSGFPSGGALVTIFTNGIPSDSKYLVFLNNTPPTITAATISRQQGAASSNSQIATVSDNEDPPTSLTVTVDGGSSSTVHGVTVSGIAIDNSGNVTANVVASCTASNATFILRVTDTGGLYNQDTLTVNVTPSNAPVITLKPATVLQPNPNHTYRAFTISNMVQSATDDCDGNVINNVVIEKATSDEVENSPGPGDGNTLNDIVIASDCKSVQLRAERDGTMNGRVYLVRLRVTDTSGNTTCATYRVSVPVGRAPAVDSGVHYTVTSTCNTNSCP